MAFDLRAKVYDTLRSDLVLQDLLEKEIYQKTGFEKEVPTKARPFMLYELGEDSPVGPSALRARAATVTVWAHDVMGDFTQIDEILSQVKVALEAAEHEGEFLELRYLGRSPDMEDLDLKTNCRYVRFSAMLTR
jgi:hypothetical protein